MPGFPARCLALRDEIQRGLLKHVASLNVVGAKAEVLRGTDSLWIRLRQKEGGYALRLTYSPGAPPSVEVKESAPHRACLAVGTSLGSFDVTLEVPAPDQPILHCVSHFTPTEDILLPSGPRDLYVLDSQGDPTTTEGSVHAAQRGMNSGYIYLTLEKPHAGTLLYLQDLTTLNSYFTATHTIPDGLVAGAWPELGASLPDGAAQALEKGKPVTLSDVFLHWTPDMPANPQDSARLFLELLGGIYPFLDRPKPEYHDWPMRSEQTLRDLRESPDVTCHSYGNLYLRPYVDAEYPDSMVQLTVLLPLMEYAKWKQVDLPLVTELRRGIKRFFDPELGVIRRYLPNVGKDKDADAVDSWYLYHPQANLGRLALCGDQEACEFFLSSVEFGIKVAHHFKYNWPVQFNLLTLDVLTGVRKPGDPGQSDVGGLYAFTMLQAWELTEKKMYLDEAKAAILAMKDLDFDLEYQANITAWGAVACERLFQITGERFYHEQSLVFIACFFHNCVIWQSHIGFANDYPTFLGVTCLHDAPYMAIYEAYESYGAFCSYLAIGGSQIEESVRLLLTEYCKFVVSNAWYYYPDTLPPEAISSEVRNGHIDRRLSFPLEDLYTDGQQAGQVGQEVYGCGAAFAFATRAYHRLTGAPFLLFCESPLEAIREDEESVRFRAIGVPGIACQIRLIPEGRSGLPHLKVSNAQNKGSSPEGHRIFVIPAGEEIEVSWKNAR
jgi:hypothetical protein